MISLNFKTTYHRNTQNPQVVQKCLEFVQSDLSTITCLTTSSLQRFGSQTKAAETLAVLGDKLEDAPCRERVVLTNFNYPHRTSRVRITGRTVRLVCDVLTARTRRTTEDAKVGGPMLTIDVSSHCFGL